MSSVHHLRASGLPRMMTRDGANESDNAIKSQTVYKKSGLMSPSFSTSFSLKPATQ
jgi:hypothetical protein